MLRRFLFWGSLSRLVLNSHISGKMLFASSDNNILACILLARLSQTFSSFSLGGYTVCSRAERLAFLLLKCICLFYITRGILDEHVGGEDSRWISSSTVDRER